VVSEDSAAGGGGPLAGFGPGSRLGAYRLEGQVGAGGMAVVFAAVDERLGRQLCGDRANSRRSGRCRRRFARNGSNVIQLRLQG